MSAPIIPGMRPGCRTTVGAFKWILLIATIGAVALYFVFHEAIRETDEIYEKTGFIPTPPTNDAPRPRR